MGKFIDLNQHFAITASAKVKAITAPLHENFGITYFRYLKLYQDKSRVLLSDFPDCTRFTYEDGNYAKMWFDGEFPEYLSQGYHVWDTEKEREKSLFEKEINDHLDLHCGVTFIYPIDNYWEIFTFDSNQANINHIDNRVLFHFMLYFKDQAAKLIHRGESERLILPNPSENLEVYQHPNKAKCLDFLSNTPINRFYLGGKYRGVYLTSKEAQCLYWLIEGKSAEEIAIIENNSVKTIHRHLENVRAKLNCYKQTQLVKIILESGIYDSIHLYNIYPKH